MIIVSACLCGENCKYNGGNNKNDKVLDFISDKETYFICPEELGGLSTPREPSEMQGNAKEVLYGNARIISISGKDVTKEFVDGAYKSLELAKKVGAKKAILKAKSPSCGKGNVYDGSFSGKLVSGNGITAQLFEDNGIMVISEENL
ncbi:DUF523 domain-containing protein [Clostridium mediterraneense]|uniref:DUF523 domain-containing protein n=1 Tax=Clostridium mediterraneense TaxID=1805472 RepID=UPI000835B0ED|nr:DUF523 domain-containing protein [Clostridium mediterraneense]